MSRFLRTLAATPEPSLTRPRRMCSVPMYSWLKRWASWLASCITLRARSVKRSYMVGRLLLRSGGRGRKNGANPSGLAPFQRFAIGRPDRLDRLLSVGRSALILGAGSHELGGARTAGGVEDELLLAVLLGHPHGDGVLALEDALEQVLRERVFEQVLDRPA